MPHIGSILGPLVGPLVGTPHGGPPLTPLLLPLIPLQAKQGFIQGLLDWIHDCKRNKHNID